MSILSTFAVVPGKTTSNNDKNNIKVIKFGCETDLEMKSWLHLFYEAKRHDLKRLALQNNIINTPPNSLLHSDRTSGSSLDSELMNITIGRPPRLVPISAVVEANGKLISDMGYILKEKYHGGPVMPFS